MELDCRRDGLYKVVLTDNSTITCRSIGGILKWRGFAPYKNSKRAKWYRLLPSVVKEVLTDSFKPL